MITLEIWLTLNLVFLLQSILMSLLKDLIVFNTFSCIGLANPSIMGYLKIVLLMY